MAFYSVKTVENLTGVNSNTIKTWERRYNAVKPGRNISGRRAFSQTEVERICVLRDLVALGHPISSVAPLESNDLQSLLVKKLNPDKSLNLPGDVDLDEIIRAMREYDLNLLSVALATEKSHRGSRSFIFDFVLPLLKRIGECVESGELSMSSEHALSSMLKFELMQILYSLRGGGRRFYEKRPDFLVCTIDGDMHEFAILCSSIMIALAGQSLLYLGPSLPVEAVVETARFIKPKRILIGSSQLVSASPRTSIKDYLEALDRTLPAECEIWLGGWSDVHADVIKASRQIRHCASFHDFETCLRSIAKTSGPSLPTMNDT